MYHAKPFRAQTALLLLFLILIFLIPFASATTFSRLTTEPTPDPSLVVVRPVQTYELVTTIPTAEPQTGYISISSIPSGASVTIDGVAMGTTPFTIRTLTTGSHDLVLQLGGYNDFSTRFIILPDTMNTETYALTPVVTATRPTVSETVPPVAWVPVTTTIPVTMPVASLNTLPATIPATTAITPVQTRQATPTPTPRQVTVQQPPATSLGKRLEQIPATVEPIRIRVGNVTKSPILNTYSPWFAAQFVAKDEPTLNITFSTPVVTLPHNFIEVDRNNVNLKKSHLMSSTEVTNDPIWADEDTVFIRTDAKFYNDTNFRWISLEPDATALYQISRYPFDANASLWQNQYVPGLVASGPVKDVYVDKEGFHYFSLNFAQVANHDPADPPYYTGTVNLDPTVPGQGKPMGLAMIPFTGSGIWYKKAKIGPFALPVPSSIASFAPGQLTELDLGTTNDNMVLSIADIQETHVPTDFTASVMETDQTFYVRVVPAFKNGTMGVGTLPVTVTVKRPQPCPTTSPSSVSNTVLVKPPTAEIKSFYMNLIIPDWVRTDQNGALVSRAHFVTVVSPPYCSAPATGNAMMDGNNKQFCAMYGGSEPGYHFYADPAESHWYDTVWDIIKGMFFALSSVVNSVSAAWAQINAVVVQIAAVYVQALTLGAFDCSSSPACTGVLHAALAAAETALGIPPTIPNFTDLENMGADYLAKVAADQIGAGGVLDAAETAYGAMPDSAKQAIKDNAGDVGDSLAGSVSSQSGATVASAAGSFYIPDPLYYKPHPAMAFVRVSNPNMQTTDQVRITVSDSQGFFKKASVIVPPLKALDSTVVPVILTEDYSKGYKTGCNNQGWTSTDGIPCYWENWNQAALNAPADKFVIEMAVKKNGKWISQITPYSSGIVLSSQNVITFDDEGKTCPGYTSKDVLKFPSGWKVQQTGLSQDLKSVMWNSYTFTNGASGRLIGE